MIDVKSSLNKNSISTQYKVELVEIPSTRSLDSVQPHDAINNKCHLYKNLTPSFILTILFININIKKKKKKLPNIQHLPPNLNDIYPFHHTNISTKIQHPLLAWALLYNLCVFGGNKSKRYT